LKMKAIHFAVGVSPGIDRCVWPEGHPECGSCHAGPTQNSTNVAGALHHSGQVPAKRDESAALSSRGPIRHRNQRNMVHGSRWWICPGHNYFTEAGGTWNARLEFRPTTAPKRKKSSYSSSA